MNAPIKPKIERMLHRLAQHIVDLNNYTDQPIERMCWCATGCCMNSMACQKTKRLILSYARLFNRGVPKPTDVLGKP